MGLWYIASRGTDPKPSDRWTWHHLEDGVTLKVLAKLEKWAAMGQHVKIEFISVGVGIPDEE